jgi:hypothetical protein
MTLLDDDIDDLLQAFRADEARIDDIIRTRIWARVCDAAPDAPTALDTLDRGARVRQLRQRVVTRPRARLLAVAAAVLVLLAVGGLSIRSGPDDDAVTAGPASTVPLPRDLQELADAVTDLPTPVLGEPGATYTYRRAIRSVQNAPTDEATTFVDQQWIGLDGSGRQAADGGGSPGDETVGAASLLLGPFAPRVAVRLPDDADAVLAAVERRHGEGASAQAAPGLFDILTYAGIPGPARAGVLRALDRIGFVPVPAPELGPTVLRVEGPDPDGSTMQADLDLRTGRVIAMTRPLSGGGVDRSTDIEVDLRRDTQGP